MLRPRGFDIYLKYWCNCGIEYILTRKEAETPGFKIVCHGCDEVYEVDTVTSLKVHYNTQSLQKPVDKQPDRDKARSDFQNKIVSILNGYGYAEKEVRGALLKAPPNLGTPDTVKWIIGELDK
jgi:hypothetical protein